MQTTLLILPKCMHRRCIRTQTQSLLLPRRNCRQCSSVGAPGLAAVGLLHLQSFQLQEVLCNTQKNAGGRQTRGILLQGGGEKDEREGDAYAFCHAYALRSHAVQHVLKTKPQEQKQEDGMCRRKRPNTNKNRNGKGLCIEAAKKNVNMKQRTNLWTRIVRPQKDRRKEQNKQRDYDIKEGSKKRVQDPRVGQIGMTMGGQMQ